MTAKIHISTQFKLVSLIVLVIAFSSCGITKTVPKGERLLIKNKIEIENPKEIKKILPEIEEQIRHKPNRKIFGVMRFHLRVYNLATSTKDSTKNNKRVRKFLRKVGDPPVIFDSSYAERSAKNIQQFLFNKGYFFAEVHYTNSLNKSKKTKVTYFINPGKAFQVSDYKIICPDTSLEKIIWSEISNSFIKRKSILNFEQMEKERNRIDLDFKERGFYLFKKEYIDFEIDTSHNTHSAKVSLNILSPEEKGKAFLPYTLDSIQVRIFSVYYPMTTTQKWIENIQYIQNDFPLNPKHIHERIMVKTNRLYNQKEVDETYRRLGELGIFDNIELLFIPQKNQKLNLVITLTPGHMQSYTAEPQLISSDLNNQIANAGNYRNYGLAGVVTYTHKNIFKGAEKLDISLSLRAESQFRNDQQTGRLFNNFQTGITANLFLPNSRLLKKLNLSESKSSIKTLISLSYFYENNLDFNRNLLPLTYSYQIFRGKSNWVITPTEIFFSKSRIEPAFLDKISQENIEFVKRLFSSNLITSSGLRWNYTNYKKNNLKDYVVWRTNILELGGNIHRLGRQLIDTEKQGDTSYQFLNVSYFQYIKSEIDFRYGKYIDPNNSIAFRFNIGAGLPFGNENILPFDKRFFIGGSNSLRGWRPRTIGPGSYRDTAAGTRIDRSGEFIIQTSFEYRFNFIKPLELALFVDAGNIWNLTTNDFHADEEVFKWNRFLGQSAINSGIGFRFDFEFFLFRLDWGIQLKDPEIIQNNGWVASQIGKTGWLNNTVLNLGIGYPF